MPDESVDAAPAIAALFAEGVVAHQTRNLLPVDSLLPEERESVAKAIAKRVHEFAGGRACARAGLSQLGFGRVPVPMDADRTPRWPAGAAGSITHTAGFCAAVVARSARIRALGLDAEPENSVKPKLWPRICTPPELAMLETLAGPAALGAATLIFSAKEAFYKCQYALTAQWLRFHDVSVALEPDRFTIEPNGSLQIASHSPGPWRGRYLSELGFTITGICIV